MGIIIGASFGGGIGLSVDTASFFGSMGMGTAIGTIGGASSGLISILLGTNLIKKKTKAPEMQMKNCGYGLPFEECIKRISMNRVSLKHEESISFDDALKFLKEEFNYIKSKNYGTY